MDGDEDQPIVNLIKQTDEFYKRAKDIYKPLDPNRREIRLMHIAPGDFDDLIQIGLETVSLDDNRKFETISYAWEYTGELKTIEVDGVSYQVTSNQFAALRRFRRRDEPRTMWKDVICIDQSNPDERGHQVRMMRNIYKQGHALQIWLGEGIEGSFDTVDGEESFQRRNYWRLPPEYRKLKLRQASDRLPPVELDVELLKDNDHVTSALHALDLLSSASTTSELPLDALNDQTVAPWWYRALKALDALCQVKWWTRAWVVQEVALALYAEADVSVHIGSKQVDLHRFLRLGHLYDDNNDLKWRDWVNLIPHIDVNDTLWSLYLFEHILKFYTRTGRLALLRCFELGVTRQATDPRDSVYSFLGLLDDGGASITVDYRRPVRELFIEATYVALKSAEYGRIFWQANLTDENSFEIPSWCYSWAGGVPAHPVIPTEIFDRDESFLAYLSSLVPGCLVLEGVEIATISACEQFPKCDPDTKGLGQKICWRSRHFLEQHGVTLAEEDWLRLYFMNSGFARTEGEKYSRMSPTDLELAKSWERCGHDCSTWTCAEHTAPRRLLSDCSSKTKVFSTKCHNAGIGYKNLQPGDKLFRLMADTSVCILRPYKITSESFRQRMKRFSAAAFKCHGAIPEPSESRETYQMIGTAYVSNWKCATDGSRKVKQIRLA